MSALKDAASEQSRQLELLQSQLATKEGENRQAQEASTEHTRNTPFLRLHASTCCSLSLFSDGV